MRFVSASIDASVFNFFLKGEDIYDEYNSEEDSVEKVAITKQKRGRKSLPAVSIMTNQPKQCLLIKSYQHIERRARSVKRRGSCRRREISEFSEWERY